MGDSKNIILNKNENEKDIELISVNSDKGNTTTTTSGLGSGSGNDQAELSGADILNWGNDNVIRALARLFGSLGSLLEEPERSLGSLDGGFLGITLLSRKSHHGGDLSLLLIRAQVEVVWST